MRKVIGYSYLACAIAGVIALCVYYSIDGYRMRVEEVALTKSLDLLKRENLYACGVLDGLNHKQKTDADSCYVTFVKGGK